MARTLLLSALCLALVLMGVSGAHAHLTPASSPSSAHVHDSAHAHDEHGLDRGHVEMVTLFGADHFHEHEEHGDTDIDPMTKAFGKLPLLKFFAIVAFVFGIVALLSRVPESVMWTSPPLRPPKNRFGFSLLPPSHAPPSTAYSR